MKDNCLITPPHISLNSKSTPKTQKYNDIIRSIREGIYQIPKFQRDFVWKLENSAKLIDSIFKGYPIGSFILWRTNTERLKAHKKFGDCFIQQIPMNEYICYILDGQQRITSLFLIANGIEIEKTNYKDVCIDLSKDIESDDEICVIKKQDEYINFKDEYNNVKDNNKNFISFYDLMYKSILDIQDKTNKEFAKKCELLKKRLEDYEFSIIEVESSCFFKIADIFTRINTDGKVLTLFEIINAKFYTEGKFDLEKKFNTLIQELKQIKYESIAKNKMIILQLIGLFLKKNVKKDAILSIEKDDFVNEWDNSIKSLKTAIDFMRSYLKIPISHFLPYSALLVAFAYFFRINEFKYNNLQAQKLSKYFFRSAFSDRFNSSSDTTLTRDAKLIWQIKNDEDIDFDKEILIQNTSKEYFVNKVVKKNFSTSSAFDKAVLCILASLSPKNFNDSSDVILDNSNLIQSNSKNYHHFFPKAYLKKQGQDNFANALANITLIGGHLNKNEIRARAPSEYINKFKNINLNLKEDLQTHLIDLDNFGILDDNYDIFLQKRAEKITDEILKRL